MPIKPELHPLYISRPEVSDGYELLKERGIYYPEESDLLEKLLKDLNVPEKAIIRDSHYVNNTLIEARYARQEAEKRGFKSLIVITSPTHSRRAWLTFKKVFKGAGIKIYSMPTGYSEFDPESYWHDRKYLKEVLLEYQKLLFYKLRYGI